MGGGVGGGAGVGAGVGVTGVALGLGVALGVGALVGLTTVTENGVLPACTGMTSDLDETAGSLLTVICSRPLLLNCRVVVATPLVVKADRKSVV